MARLLLEQPELDLAKRNLDGCTALHWACMGDSPGCLELLLLKDKMVEQVNVRSKRGNTALMVAIRRGSLACVRLLLEQEGARLEGREGLEDLAREAGRDKVLKVRVLLILL